jgi:uncharacterized repeat protein (TIGR01451 family)
MDVVVNVLSSFPQRVARVLSGTEGHLRAFLAFSGAMALVVAILGVVPANAVGLGGAAGTVKLDGTLLNGGNDNSPHNACNLVLEYYGFGLGAHTATVTFTAQPPSGNVAVPSVPDDDGTPVASVFTFTGLAGNAKEAQEIYNLDTTVMTLAPQGYHVSIDVVVDGVAGKSKTIYAQACTPAITVDKTNDANNDTAFTDSETAPVAGQAVTFQAVITNGSSVSVTIDSLADFVGAPVVPAVTCRTSGGTDVVGITLAASNAGNTDEVTCTFTVANYSPAVGAGSTTNTLKVDASQAGLPAVHAAQATDTSIVTTAAPTPVTPALKPTIIASSCVAGAAVPSHYLVPITANVTYSVTGVGVVVGGTTRSGTAPAAETLTAAADPGYVLTAAFSELMSFTALATLCAPVIPAPLTQVAAVAPAATQSQCSAGVATVPSYTVPTTPGVIYTPSAGGTATPGSTVTVTAAAAAGYALSGPASFPLVFAAAPDCAENVGVSKTGPGSAQPGDELVYAIDVTNVKGTPARGFTVTDVLPTGLSFSSATGTDFTCTNAGQTITCVYSGSLPAGQKATIAVRALLDGTFTGKTVANTAVVDPGRADTDAADNSSTATTTVVPLPLTGGGGGTAVAPSPTPAPAASGGGAALPFTGSDSARQLQAGVSLLVLGLFLALIARRRRASSE